MAIYQTLMASIGGIAVVLSGLFWWLGKRYLDKVLEKEISDNKQKLAVIQSQIDITIEKFKESSSKNLFVFKSQFEVEFESYKAMWEALDLMSDYVFRLEKLYVKTESSYGDKKAWDEAETSFIEAMRVFRTKKPFVNLSVQKKMLSYGLKLNDELIFSAGCIKAKKGGTPYSYSSEGALAKKRFDNLEKMQNNIAEMISDRLAKIMIING